MARFCATIGLWLRRTLVSSIHYSAYAFPLKGIFNKFVPDELFINLRNMKRQEIKFGITDDSRRAATWKLVTPKSKSDIYLSCRELRGAIKASMHQSGSWHLGYTKETGSKYFETEESFYENQYIEKWPRPKPISKGITLAFRIVTPFSAVITPVEKNQKKIIWISNCQEGQATEIDIIITSKYEGLDNWPGEKGMGTKIIGSYNLDNGETVWVVYWYIPMPNLSSISGNTFQFFKGRNKSELKSNKLKAIIFADENDGARTLFDCAVDLSESIKI